MNPPILLPLIGAPCAVCGLPARFVDIYRLVHHEDHRKSPCWLPPLPEPEVPRWTF